MGQSGFVTVKIFIFLSVNVQVIFIQCIAMVVRMIRMIVMIICNITILSNQTLMISFIIGVVMMGIHLPEWPETDRHV